MPIVLNVPCVRLHKLFLPHIMEFYAANKAVYDLCLNWQTLRPLERAQEAGLNLAREKKASHILFVEDDHWGFPIDGLEVLLEADKEVVGFQTYKKTHPYTPFNFRKKDPHLSLITSQPNLQGFYQADGPEVQPCDLVTWAMMLVRTEVFDRLKINPFRESTRQTPTDSAFCQACLDVGIQPHVHFGAIIGHGDVEPAEIPYRRWMADNIKSGRPLSEAMPRFGLEVAG